MIASVFLIIYFPFLRQLDRTLTSIYSFYHHSLVLLSFYSTSKRSHNSSKLAGHWITGFTDAEGCFNIVVTKNSSISLGWRVQARFIIELHVKDLDL
jgi:hypothetical protein